MTKPTVAIIGASADASKFGNKSVRAHQCAGYDVYPVNPKEETIEGLKVYKSILGVPVELDRISLYLPPPVALNVLDDVAKKGCKELWVNPGVESPELMERSQRTRFEHDLCVLILRGAIARALAGCQTNQVQDRGM